MKRKIKLLFIAISICAMLFAFAISSSAESTCEIVWYFPEGTSFNTIQSCTEEHNIKCEFEGSFTTFKIDAKDSNDYYKTAIALNVLEFQNFCKLYNLTDISSFNSFMCSLNGQEGISTEVYNWSSPFTYDFLNEESFNFFYNYNLITQDDVDSAVDEAVAKALADAGLAMTSDTFIYILNDNIPDFLTSSSATFVWWNFENYSIGVVFYPDSSVEKPYIFIVDGARAYYEDITNNVEVKTDDNIFGYLCTKREGLDSYLYYDAEELYNEVASSLIEVPSADDLQAKYDEGKVAGATEYKSSEEYTTILNTQYSTGYSQGEADGVTEFKSSDEYSATLNAKYNDGFVNGTAEGALAYTKSDAYKTALADKYDEGYDDGFVEGEAQFDIAPFIGVISIMALISIGIVIVCWVRKKRIG